MKLPLMIFGLIVGIFMAPAAATQQPAKAIQQPASNPKVALLISGYGKQGDPAISYDLEELAQAYLVLQQNGLSLDILSPKGGAVPVHNRKDDLPYMQQFKQQTPALRQLQQTLAPSAELATQYAAVFIIGGDGAMFDLPVDAGTQQFLQAMLQQKKLIAAVCHGPAALVNLKNPDGSYWVAGKEMNSFTLREEQAFSAELLDKFPFILETRLREHGALFVANQPMLPFVAHDDLLITAQNPMSVPAAADLLALQLGQTPRTRTPFPEEATMALLATARSNGVVHIDIALAQQPGLYDLNYLALYGMYSYRLAQTPADKSTELRLMAKIAEHFQHPQYQLALLQAYLAEQQLTPARALYLQLQEQAPKLLEQAGISSF